MISLNIDKLIKDSLNDRTYNLDISPEKSEEILDYIEKEADKASQSSFQKPIDRFKDFIANISVRQWATASLVLLFIITIPFISKNLLTGNKSTEKLSVSPKSKDNNGPIADVTDGSKDNPSVNYPFPNASKQQNIIITLIPKFNTTDSQLYLTEDELDSLVKYLYSQGISEIYINDIYIKESSIIKSSDDGKSLLIDSTGISVTDTITIKAISNSKKDSIKNLKIEALENYKIDIEVRN